MAKETSGSSFQQKVRARKLQRKRSNWRQFWAVFISILLCVQMVSIGGIPFASAASAANGQELSANVNENENESANAGEADVAGGASSSEGAGGASASATESDGANKADGSALSGTEASEGETSETAPSDADGSNAAEPGADQSEGADGALPAEAFAVRDAQDWTGLLDDLKLDASLRIADPDPTLSPAYAADPAAQTGSESADPADAADSVAADSENTENANTASVAADQQGATASVLPESLPATLTVRIELNPQDEGAFVRTGDWFRLTLPEGFALADASTPANVVALDDQGNPTETTAGAVSLVDGALKATFAADAPESALSEDTQAQATPDQAQAALVKVPANADGAVVAQVELPVMVDASLLGDEPRMIEWVLQQDEAGAQQTAWLQLPARAELEQLWAEALATAGAANDAEGDGLDAAASPEGAVAAAQNVLADVRETLQSTTTVQAGPFDTQVHSQTIWCDNNHGDRPTADSLEAGYIPQYSLDAGVTFYDLVNADGTVTQQAKDDLHLSDDQVRRIESGDLIQITRSAVNTYDVATSALPSRVVTTTTAPILDNEGKPTYDENGNQEFYTTEVSTLITWQLKDTNEYAGYLPGSSSTWDKQYKMLAGTVTFNVVGKIGDNNLKETFLGNPDDFRFGATIDGEDRGSDSVAGAVENGWLHIEDTGDASCTVSGTVPMYDEQGYPIVYYLTYTGEKSGEDYYQASYDNSASANHGGATDAVYDGGTLTLRHAGTTTFEGTKVWLDGGNQASRPAVTYTLWRYSTQGSPATASQVTVASLHAENPETSAPNATGFVEVTAPAGSGEIDLHQLLIEEYGEALVNALPKYDPDGYPYIYAMREEAVAGYEQVFGTVAADGVVTDTNPRYENEAGDGYVDVDRGARPDTDRFVYNGGTLSNRLTGTTTAQMTKTWQIAAFQDSLQEVECEFTAQSRPKDSTDDADWRNVEADGAVQTLTAWNAETLAKTVSQSFPKYDAQGEELEYRWIETGVSFGGQDTRFTTNADGTASFTLNVESAEGTTEELLFTSTPITQEGADGSYATTIVNTFENVTDQHVDKYWEQADGTLAQIAPDPAYTDGDAIVELYRDGALIGTFTMDGRSDEDATPIEGLDGATWQETRSYHIDFEDLPKYSPEGTRYTYLVLETSKDGWTTERSYDPDTRTTRIDNYLPIGEGSEIRITKKWIDGDDAEHRYQVEVTLYAAHDMQSRATDEEGDPLYAYQEDDPVMERILLSEDGLWYTEVDVPIGGLTYSDFYVRETALIDDRGTETTEDDVRYPVVSIDEAKELYPDEDWVNVGWTNPDNRRVATPEHVYEVRYQANDTLKSAEVTNRRLGLFDLTVTKTWNDALGADEDKTRPAAALTLSCDEYAQAFSKDADGTLRVSVSGNRLPVTVTDADGNPVETSIVDADGNPAESGSLRVEVDTTKANATYHFEGMPKYDANGLNVHYSVNEGWTGEYGDYYSTKTVGDYVVQPGARHFQDSQTVDFNNNRSGTRDVVFYKQWHDNYVSQELNQRPDIHLTLYRVSANLAEPEAVPGYVHFSWSAMAESGDAGNEQKVTISGLPKYDSQGAEYVYYASETMSADGTSLGYGDVRFAYDSIDEADARAEAEQDADTLVVQDAENAVKVGETESDNPQENGTGWAIREDGTFVNSLEGTLVANGTKLWENVPGNMVQGDLPEMTVYLQQKLSTDDEWPEMKADAETREVSGTVASTSDLKPTANNQYTYTINADYQGKPLPRYDEYGNRYEYRAVEIIWGLLDQPGGFTAEEIENADLSDIHENGDSAGLLGAVFVIQHGETGSFLLRNVYDGASGKLTVKKLFDGREASDTLYPDVTFNVYRYYLTEDGTPSPVARAASHTLTQADFEASSAGEAGNRSATYTFEDLEIYAPDGSRWIYFVTENSINGYTTTVATGDIDEVDSRLTPGEMVDASGAPAAEGAGVAMRSGDLGDADETVIADNDTVDVTFANVYEPDSADLQGTKVWSDYNNIFNVRPDTLDLTFTRSAGGVTENVAVQTGDKDAENYLVWTAKDKRGDWTFELLNIEKWAPNGQPWTYTVKEDLPQGAEGHYTIVAGSSTVSTTSGASFALRNALNGQAAVEKEWADGEDPYGLRPDTVSVQLQARTVAISADGTEAGVWSTWTNAYDVWQQFASEEDLAEEDLDADSVNRTLSDNTGWRGSWNDLPIEARSAGDQLYKIEYRAVETAIGDQPVEAPDENGEYTSPKYPYHPSQEQLQADAINSFKTRITNTLNDTEIQATKAWENDDADAWGTRPGGDNWSVTYFLQRATAGTDAWEWVVETGSGANPEGSATQYGVVSLVVTSADVDASGTYTVKWDYLPSHDAGGTAYDYRVVEQVPGSYDVVGGTEVQDDDTAHRYYVVASTNEGHSQTFANALRTVDLTGTKAWDDQGIGIAPDFDADKAPTMVLYRQVEGGQPEQVKMKDGSAPAQPEWNDNDGDGVWTFVYRDLPAADQNDKPYTYWAEEQVGSVDGWYPTYGTADAAGTSITGDQQTGTTITNHPTLVNLAKTSDFDGDTVTLRNIELTVLSTDGKTTYAIWTNGDDGQTFSAKVWPEGTADTSVGGIETDDSIVGLKAGDYLVRETGEVPEGYAQAPDMTFHLNANGTAAAKDGVVTTTEDGVSSVAVTVEDPVLRGHLELAKYVSEDGTVEAADAAALEGATFDLYRVDMDGDGQDELIASGLTTDANGKVTTVGNGKETNATGTAGGDLTYGGKYTKLSDGLPEGRYYFVETATTPGAVLPEPDAAKSDVLTITQKDHYATTNAPVSGKMANKNFGAEVKLVKFDKGTGDPIDGAVFSLKYRPEGSADAGYPVDLGTFTTQADPDIDNHHGIVCFPDLEKGSYLVEEVSNPGYSGEFQATFTISNEDDGHTYVVWQDDGAAIDFTVTKGEIDHGFGIPNDRLTGQATLRKLGAGGNIDATFELQMKQPDGSWATVASDLSTGNSYELAFNADGVTATANDTGDLPVGQLRVTGLTWNTYRFAETATSPGYELEDANGQITREFTISCDNVAAGASLMIQNERTDLVIKKQNEVDDPLNGAVFTVTPIEGSAFADGTTEAKELTTAGSGTARLTGQLVVGDTYEIYEKQGPSGYNPVDATFRVFVENDGDLTVVDETGSPTALPAGYERADVAGAGSSAFSFIATNDHMAIKLTKVSAADGTTPLAGATFRLTGLCMDGNSTHTYTTNDEGVIGIDAGLRSGVTYTLIEDKTPSGYLAMGSLSFEMDDRGEIQLVGDAPQGWTVNDDKISFTAADEPTRLVLQKVDEQGAPLDGAEFTVAPADGSTFANDSTNPVVLTTQGATDADGQPVSQAVLEAALVVGSSYTIRETGSPEGYEVVPDELTVTVAEDGTLEVQGDLPQGYSRPEGSTFVLSLADTPVEIGLVKTDAADGADFLPGAEFRLEGDFANDDVDAPLTVTTDENGRIDLHAQLIVGQQYTLTETKAPAGFEKLEGTLTFEVAEDGTLQLVGDAPEGYSLRDGDVTISVKDEGIQATLQKVSAGDDPQPQEGAAFSISGIFANNATHEAVERELTVTTGPDGTAQLSGIRGSGDDAATYGLIAGETYTVAETHAPDGFKQAVESFSFTVGEDGTLAAAAGSVQALPGAEGFRIGDDDVTLQVADAPIQLALSKRAADGTPLAGATFALAGPVPADTVLVTGEDGMVSISDATTLLVGGTYTLTEVTAPTGYELLAEPFTLTIGADGTVQPAGEAAGWQVSGDGIVLTATDQPIEAKLVKTDFAGKRLKGAVFELTPVAGEGAEGEGAAATFANGSADPVRLETNWQGEAVIESGLLVAGGTYRLEEVEAPRGYELAGSAVLTVAADGTIAIEGAGEPGAAVDGDGGSGTYAASAEDGVAMVTVADAEMPGETGFFADTGDGMLLMTLALSVVSLVAIVCGSLSLRRLRRR